MPKRLKKRAQDSWFTKVFSHPAGQLAAFAGFVVALVLLVTADFDQSERLLRELTVGDTATKDIIAQRDFTYVQRDEVATRMQREQVANETPAVFDWQEGLNAQLRKSISEAFDQMRAQLALRVDGQSDEAPDQIIARADPSRRVAISRELRQEYFDQKLGVQLRDSDFEAFARNGFSAGTESQLVELVSEVMSNIIVASRRILEMERERGIFLRRMRDNQVLIEYHVADIDSRFVSLERTPVLVEEAAATSLTSVGDRELRNAIISTASSLMRPNTNINQSETLARRSQVQSGVADQLVREEIREGQVLIHRGEVVTQRHRRQIDTMLNAERSFESTQGFAGVVLLSLIFVTTLHIFGRRNLRFFASSTKDLIFVAASMLLMLGLTRFSIVVSELLAQQLGFPSNFLLFGIPFAAAGMLIRLVLNSEHATIFTIVFALLVGVMGDQSLELASFAAIGGFVGAGGATKVRSRLALIWSGLIVGGVNALLVLAILLMNAELFSFTTLAALGLAVFGGVLSGFLVSALLPIVESVFEYTTDVKLLELANLDHPALRELIMRAPGSYHHSMMVSSLCEAAAEAIQANALLARVGAYYHDIGKAKNPGYFAENQKLGVNPHDKLKPNMSALIIKAHVKDGLEMARQHRLPKAIQDFIAQHHGTSLIAYFYHKAKQQEDPDIQEVDEKDYRYPGPRPQSREIAICLLADGIEAASRAMPEPTPAKLKGLVQTMISNAFTTGQLDECDLTLKDLNTIATAFHRILTGIYHHRPEYPGEKKDKSSDADKRQKPKKPKDEEVATSDVWELTERARQEEENGSGTDAAGEGRKPSAGGTARKNDKDSRRTTLPRLGGGGS